MGRKPLGEVAISGAERVPLWRQRQGMQWRVRIANYDRVTGFLPALSRAAYVPTSARRRLLLPSGARDGVGVAC
jgi:hypothetical protein